MSQGGPEQTSGLDLQIGCTVKAWDGLSKSHAGDETVGCVSFKPTQLYTIVHTPTGGGGVFSYFAVEILFAHP